MKVRIQRIEKDLPLPSYQTEGAVAFDLYSRIDIEVPPRSHTLIPTNIIVEIPPGYMLLLAVRSSTPRRKGLMKSNGVGIVDQDFCGAEDEIHLQVYNPNNEPVMVQRGERIGQAVFVPIERAEWEEGEMTGKTRGGFGSTGK